MQRLAIGSFLGVILLLLAFTARVTKSGASGGRNTDYTVTGKLTTTSTLSVQAAPHLYKQGCRP